MKLFEYKGVSSNSKFIEKINSGKPMLILYYADWCGHCNEFKGSWNQIANILSKNRKINVVQVEHSNLKGLPSKYNAVNGFPTIRIIKGSKIIEYNGTRSTKSLIEFLATLKFI
jgi:thiol-disulfide isomerase/thioredoxin